MKEYDQCSSDDNDDDDANILQDGAFDPG